MKKIVLSESQFNDIITKATIEAVNEGLGSTMKNLGYGALGAAGMLGTLYGNAQLHDEDEPDPMETSVRQSVDDFRQQNLDDKVKSGEISYQDAVDMFKNGKGYANESFVNRIIKNVINETIKNKKRA